MNRDTVLKKYKNLLVLAVVHSVVSFSDYSEVASVPAVQLGRVPSGSDTQPIVYLTQVRDDHQQ